ncbi:serine/threonine-protein kinase [Panacagrimonas perspica]|uniref:Serine/threonine-protein kinase n=1 Tax=Panacagrimonas perspica TaxID=381431 RepID=A0A4R7NX54_9GAMM|nr:serine/threonine-protein kinase [Panacagrimonas perspica]TDU25825.1 serine/threonine-protein kinase [Panacagrimonas perspica]THD02807.1 hypothetical protein B1810_12870 [Panacagrimonas perspica]
MTAQEQTHGDGAGLPSRVGPYRILSLLGEGSTSRVYLAEQAEPAREVALKLLRGIDLSSESRQRFRREAALLAPLEHPGIARLYAAGLIDDEKGPQPYLAIEYVRGGDLLSFARERALDLHGKLALMAAVCRAVHYAHTRGIVHRDLKPANILVDAHGQPKILDFGVARMIEDDGSQMTRVGQVLGTVPYMSAEQLAGGAERSDPRSDVYSLGVIAYELLSGRLPYPGLSKSTVIEAISMIRSGRAERLSRHVPATRGDIETVVMKAMATESSRRYGSAAEMAVDFERVIDQRPIEARAPGAAYVLGLFVRRHRGVSAALLVAALALIAGSAVSLRFAVLEGRARQEAETRALQLDASNAFVENILSASDPEAAQSRPRNLRDFLDAARLSLDSDLSMPPPVRAIAARTMALTYARSGDVERGLALIDQAQTAFDAAGNADAYTRDRLRLARAEILAAAGRYADALAQLQPLLRPEAPRDALALRQWIEARSQALSAVATLGRTREAADAAAPLRADAERLLGAGDKLSLAATAQQIELRHQLGDGAGALADYALLIPRLVENLGPNHPYTLQARLAQAAITREQGDLPQSEKLTRALMTDLNRELGPRHMLTITTQFMLAAALQSQHPESIEAVDLMRAVLAQYREQLGPDHHYTLSAMSALAVFLQKQNQLEEAADLSRQALDSAESQGFADGPEVLPKYNTYAQILMQLNRLDEACPRFESLVSRANKALGPSHLQTLTFAANEGECLSRAKKNVAAVSVLEPSREQALQHLGAAHPLTRLTTQRLASAYRALGRTLDAQRLEAAAP